MAPGSETPAAVAGALSPPLLPRRVPIPRHRGQAVAVPRHVAEGDPTRETHCKPGGGAPDHHRACSAESDGFFWKDAPELEGIMQGCMHAGMHGGVLRDEKQQQQPGPHLPTNAMTIT